MKRKRNDGSFAVDINEPCWRSFDEHPMQNGWYDVCFDDGDTYKIALGLYRDGEWVDRGSTRKTNGAWRMPLKMQDSKGHPCQYDEGALKLAALIIEGICDNYREAYSRFYVKMHDGSSGLAEAKNKMESIERQIRSPFFQKLSMSVSDPQEIIDTLQRQVRSGK